MQSLAPSPCLLPQRWSAFSPDQQRERHRHALSPWMFHRPPAVLPRSSPPSNEMPPFLLSGIVGLHGFPTGGAGKHASSGEIDEDPYDPSAFIKLHLCNHPW